MSKIKDLKLNNIYIYIIVGVILFSIITYSIIIVNAAEQVQGSVTRSGAAGYYTTSGQIKKYDSNGNLVSTENHSWNDQDFRLTMEGKTAYCVNPFLTAYSGTHNKWAMTGGTYVTGNNVYNKIGTGLEYIKKNYSQNVVHKLSQIWVWKSLENIDTGNWTKYTFTDLHTLDMTYSDINTEIEKINNWVNEHYDCYKTIAYQYTLEGAMGQPSMTFETKFVPRPFKFQLTKEVVGESAEELASGRYTFYIDYISDALPNNGGRLTWGDRDYAIIDIPEGQTSHTYTFEWGIGNPFWASPDSQVIFEVTERSCPDNVELNSNKHRVTIIEGNTTIKHITVTNTTNPPQEDKSGFAQINKIVPSGYSGKDAKFTIYTDTGCTIPATTDYFKSGTIETFIIDEDNKSNIIEFNIPTEETEVKLYIKETVGPSQTGDFDWIPNKEIYELVITEDNTDSNPKVLDVENTVQEYGYLVIEKELAGNVEEIEEAGITGEFKFLVEQRLPGGISEEVGTVSIQIENGKVIFTSEPIRVKVGHITITEIAWPEGVTKDVNVVTFMVTKDNTILLPKKVFIRNFFDKPSYFYLTKKADNEAKNELVNGAKFTLYNEDGVTIAKDWDGNNVILTVENNKTEVVKISKGNYVLKETKVPDGFSACPDIPITITEQHTKNNPKLLPIVNTYQKAYVYVRKTSDRPDLLNTYPIKGLKFVVYTDFACRNIAKDINGQDVVLKVKENGLTEEVSMALGTYYAKEDWSEIEPDVGLNPDWDYKIYWYEDPGTITFTLDTYGEHKEVHIENVLKKAKVKVRKVYEE